jgi:signal transduction histidine kinase
VRWTPRLRWRLTAALLAVSALTLAVAAASLLIPLDALLRNDALTSLSEEARTARPRFDALPSTAITPGSPRLAQAARTLRRQTSADALVVDDRGRVLAATDPDRGEVFPGLARAIRRHRLVSGIVTTDGEREATVAIPLEAGGRRFALALRKSLKDERAARDVVARALLVAGLIGLAVALVAGAGLAGRLVRRLAALRDTSLRVAELGPLAEVQDDDTRDEVGDLTRAFATMQRRLREQESARRTFVSTASHELRTPLASLLLMLHSAREELEAPEPDLPDTLDQLDRAVSQTERLRKLSAELLDLSRLDAGVPLRSEPIELVEVARSVLAEFEPRTALAGATITLTRSEQPWAMGDPGSVAQILRILLDNALRHAPPGEPIQVDVGTNAGRPAVTVRDAGPGVAPADATRIFERFERAAGVEGDSGFGLGLAIGRELARRMGGDLVLLGGPPGARFRLVLRGAGAEVEDERAAPRA